MKYIVKFNHIDNEPKLETNSRDSKRFVRNYGVNRVYICNKSGRVISAAERDANNNIYNIETETYNRMLEIYGHY